jgi:phage terminase large subunit-like protein
MRMEPHFISGRILLANDLHDEFIRQMETFPGGDHDDGPDALEGAVKLALDGEARERSAAEVTHPRRTEARKF